MSSTEVSTKKTLDVELNGINTIQESERKGKPRDLFWPWFASNISVLGIAYGAFLLGFGISFWQATIVGVVGIVVSFLLVGFVSLAGKRGNAPTMTLSRAAFGVNGNRLPSFISWILTVGWETVLTATAVLATATVFAALGWDGGTTTKIIALIVVVALIIVAGVIGFDLIAKVQQWITIITAVLTVVYVILVAPHINFDTLAALPAGTVPAVIGGLVFMMTGFGLGWVNAGADYSRYLPRTASSRGVIAWTTFASSLAPVILLIFGLMLAGSSKDLSDALYNDPIGALSTILPIWFLIPFMVVAILGLVGGAVLDIYSSGLALLNVGVKVRRPVAAGIDGVLMILGTIYVVFIAQDFFFPFQGFLITLGVPVAAWCGIFLADILMRKEDYSAKDLLTSKGRYGSVRWAAVALIVLGTAVGWGFVTNTYAPWLAWEGYLLGPLATDWSGANLGVLFALVIGFVGYLIFGRASIRTQEAAK